MILFSNVTTDRGATITFEIQQGLQMYQYEVRIVACPKEIVWFDLGFVVCYGVHLNMCPDETYEGYIIYTRPVLDKRVPKVLF